MSEPATHTRLDDQQRLAVETIDRSVAVVAGAGTGKTTVLVERFVALLDAHPDWPITAIVAITFTERAAEEMRSRVRQRIRDRLASAVGTERRRWSDHLARIEAARISTIHSMASEIIRANAAAVGVDPAFRVAEPASEAVLMRDAVRTALRDIAGSYETTLDRDAVAAQAVLTRYDLTIVEPILLNPKPFGSLNPPPSTFEDVESIRERVVAREIEMLSASDAARDVLSIDVPTAADLQAALVLAAQASLRVAADQRVPITDKVASLTALKFSKSVGQSAKWASDQLLKFARDSMDSLRSVIQTLDLDSLDRDIEEAALQYAHGWHALINRVLAAYEDRKRAENVLDFDDLEIKAEQLLARPEIRRRYAGREILHVMVDEFQDTNRRQWNIARSLAPDLMDGGVFIVGDPKQSIYAFRGADVTIFKTASDEIARAGGLIVHMNRSYRTHHALIAQMNDMFGTVMTPNALAARPEQFVTFDASHALVANRESPEGWLDIQLFDIDMDGVSVDYALAEARVVAAEIRDMVVSKRVTVVDRATQRPRAAGYGDFAVLLRKFKGISRLYEQSFVDHGIPYVTQSGGGFYERREIRDLIELLKALRNPADDLALAAALHSPLFALSDVDLITLRTRGGTLDEALTDEANQQAEHESLENPIVFASQIIDGLRAIAGHVTADVLLSQAVAETNYLASLGRLPDGRQMRANVEKLIDIAREYGSAALPDFIAFLDVSREAQVSEASVPLDSTDAVRLTTVHGCKGLEYPIVWFAYGTLEFRYHRPPDLIADESIACRLPKIDEDMGNNKTNQSYLYRRAIKRSVEAQTAESQRLLYVAATRARDALFVSTTKSQRKFLLELSGSLSGVDLTRRKPVAPPKRVTETRQRLDDTSYPLAETLPAAPPPARRSLTATDIADYGGLSNAERDDERARYLSRMRRRLHGDDDDPVETLTYDAQAGMPSPRRIGSLVHDALLYRVDVLAKSDGERADRIIESLVWEAGITLPEAHQPVVGRVRDYLNAYMSSPVALAVEEARQVYRELPFVVERDGQLVHGIMDLVYQDRHDHWYVVDFKTDQVANDPMQMAVHARRYLLQLAVYTRALHERTGTRPTAQVVYLLHPKHVVTLSAVELDRELDSLKLSAIADFVAGPDWQP